MEKESLMTRISEACDSLYMSDFKGFVSHSAKCFAKCLNKENVVWMGNSDSFSKNLLR